MRMGKLVTGRVRFGAHWRINVSAHGCGGIGVMARWRIGTLMSWRGRGGVRWHVGIGCVGVGSFTWVCVGVCAVWGAWGVGAHWHAGAC